jgi:hypothetical protein
MTFFSKAARIWIQGLRTVAGEVANAIEANPCLRRLCNAGPVHPSSLGNGSPGAQSLRFVPETPLTNCLLAAGLPLKKPLGLWMKNRSVGRWETFVERSR